MDGIVGVMIVTRIVFGGFAPEIVKNKFMSTGQTKINLNFLSQRITLDIGLNVNNDDL